MNQPRLAKTGFLNALDIRPDETECKANLALAYDMAGMVDSAIYWYKKVLDVKHSDANLYYTVGRIYGIKLNQLDSAIKYISMAIDVDADFRNAYVDLALAYNLKGEPDAAILVSEKCLAKYNDYLPALRNLLDAYTNKNDQSKVQEYKNRIAALTNR